MGKMKLVSFSLFLDAFPPRLKMPFGQRHVAINIYNICRGHFDQPCTMFFFKICAFLYMYLYVHCFFSICLTASTQSASLGFAQYMFINMETSFTFNV